MPVMVAYADIPSARDGLARLGADLRRRDAALELHPMLWRFDQLHDPRWRQAALLDAARARTLVLTMADIEAFCPRIQAWLDELLEHLRGAALRVVVLIGEAEAWTITLSAARPRPHPAAQAAPRPKEVFGGVAAKTVAARAA